ncbi:MAG: hypothetical protein ABF289_08740 [Clostridiales bacterium]
MLKKYWKIILICCVLISFIAFDIIHGTNNDKKSKTLVKKTDNKNVQEDLLLPGELDIEDRNSVKNEKINGRQYEDIINGFIQARKIAIDSSEESFIKDYLEEGTPYSEKVLNEVKKKINLNFTKVSFIEVKELNDVIHNVLFEIIDGKDKGKKIMFKIKSRKEKLYIILEEHLE